MHDPTPPVAASPDLPHERAASPGAPEPAGAERRQSGTALSLPHVAGLIRAAVPPMHPGGRPLVAAVAGAAAVARVVTGRGTVAGVLATAATALFFRNPRRVRPPLTGVALAAADGTVATVSDVLPPAELDLPREPAPRVSVFLSVLDVHVQRVPVDGRVLDIAYRPGTFLSADLDKASEDNERNAVLFETSDGTRLGVVQIAGLLARRIVCDIAPGDEVAAGETFGLIRFGSRVDVYLPPGSRVTVAPGQRTIGGETVLAELPRST
jgi:phosphatidylserine decarboxylase